MKLRVLLFVAFTLISAVPVLMLATWVERSAVEKEIHAVQEKHLLLAHNLSSTLSRYVQDVESGFRLMVANMLNGTDITGVDRLLTSLNLKHVVILDASNTVVQTLRHGPGVAVDLSSIPTLDALRLSARAADETIVFSDIVRVEDKPVFLVAQALDHETLAVGVLATDYLIKVQQAITFGERGHSMIVDQTGKVIAHPNQTWQEISKDASKISVVQAMMRGETGVSTFYSPPMQADMIAGHTAVPKVGWGVMVPQPMQELLDRTRDVKGAALKISLLGMMIAGLISWWLSKSLARPIEAVRHAAHAIASGQLDTQVPALTKRAPVELQDLAHSFNQMVNHLSQTHQEWLKALRAAEQASRAKSEFLANLSHELRTPLHGILSFAEFGIETVDTDSNEELETYFQRIHQSGATLLTLLNALLDLAKLEAGKMAFRFEPVDLGQLFDSAIDEVRTLVVQRHLTIRHDPFDTPIETVVDSEKTMQVIRNLLNNAVKFSPEGGSITIDMHQDSQSVIITISDQGPGIPDAELESIFDKFIQSSRTNTGAGGTGLGLAICREIVMAHQGRIWAENAAGGGARLILELPLQGRNKAALEPVSIRTEHAVVNG